MTTLTEVATLTEGIVDGNGHVTIPASVTSIATQAFYQCSSLASVSYESGSQLATIGANAFRATSTEVATLTEVVNGLKADGLSDEDTNILTNVKDGFTFKLLIYRLDHYNFNYAWTDDFNKNLSHKKERHENFPSSISENIAKFAICKTHGIMPTWDTTKGDLEIHFPSQLLFEQIEVKGFMSDGPLSFGPGEGWKRIYFVDAKDTLNNRFKVYEINLSNTCETWKNIIISGCVFETEDLAALPEDLEDNKKWTKKNLKTLCKKRGLTMGGNKTDIILRLKNEAPGSKHKPPKTFGDIVKQKRRGELRGSFEKIFQPQLGDHCKLIFDGHISELDNTV